MKPIWKSSVGIWKTIFQVLKWIDFFSSLATNFLDELGFNLELLSQFIAQASQCTPVPVKIDARHTGCIHAGKHGQFANLL